MSRVRRMLIGVLGHGLAIAIGLSVAFLVLLAVTSPVVAAAVTVPASVAVGAVRARHVSLATPHCLTAPTFDASAVTNAPRAAAVVSSRRASSAA